jgi:hypothetical protein
MKNKYNVGDIIIFQYSLLSRTNPVAIIKEIGQGGHGDVFNISICGRPDISKYWIHYYDIKERIYQHNP